MNILLIGNGAREHAIAEAIMRSRHNPVLLAYMKTNNPGIAAIAEKSGGTVAIGDYGDLPKIVGCAQAHGVKLAVIGPEDPLADGVADALKKSRHSHGRAEKKAGPAGKLKMVCQKFVRSE